MEDIADPYNLIVAGYNPYIASKGWEYHPEIPQRIIKLIENNFKQHKGSNELFKLSDWQKRVIRNIYGWGVYENNKFIRRYRRVYLEIPRKNGKSSLIGCLSIIQLAYDNEIGADIVLAATKREQCKEMYDSARYIIEQNPILRASLRVLKSLNKIEYKKSNSNLYALSTEGKGSHGLNVHTLLIDECHCFSDNENHREFLTALNTASGSRKNPLSIVITTAGGDKYTPCYTDYHTRAKEIINDPNIDPRYLPIIFSVPDGDRDYLLQDDTIAQANPNINVSVDPEYIKEQVRNAITPSQLADVKRLHYNIWNDDEIKFIDIKKYEECNWEISDEELKNYTAFGGIDLSSTQDISTVALCFDLPNDRVGIKTYNFIPAASRFLKFNKSKGYDWGRLPNVTITDGDRIDYYDILHTIKELDRTFNIECWAYDRFNSTWLIKECENIGLKMVGFGQGFLSMSDPTKDFERRVVDTKLNHFNCPLLKYACNCATIEQDKAGNIKIPRPKYGNQTKKVDPLIASIMALGMRNTTCVAPNIFIS